MADGYNLQDVESHTWSTSAHGLEAEVEIRSWPKHEKVIVAGTTHAEEDDISGCEHLQVIAATGKARCHGCLQILDFLNRCSECGIELCDFCRPKSLD